MTRHHHPHHPHRRLPHQAGGPDAQREAARYRDEMHKARALVADGNPNTRSMLGTQLRDLGVGQVTLCSRIVEARLRLETGAYDIVLCESEFPDDEGGGQQLLDDLRRNQLLPLTTVFIMITGEATYSKVAEAAESALDSYLIKPFNIANLADRLAHARRRKAMLADILVAVDEGRYEDAARQCLNRFHARGEYWLYAARIGAELLLNLNRHEEARHLYDAVLAARALPWAKLGIARTQIEGGDTSKAIRTLESLIAEQPDYVDAYDVMGRAQLEQGDFDGAMQVYHRALALTPESLARLQKTGMLAYYRGDQTEAIRCFERAVRAGIGSKMFDWQTAVLLAFARFAEGDTRGLMRCRDDLAAALGKAPKNPRQARFDRIGRTLVAMLYQQVGEAVAHIRGLAAEIDASDFDVEAASNLVTLLSLLAATELRLPEAEAWIERIALRHAGTRILCELLVRAARGHAAYVERIQDAHASLGRIAESAMVHAIRGRPEMAVRQLFEEAGRTLSVKLLDTARGALTRHRGRIAEADALGAEIDALGARLGPSRSPLVETNGRKAGALLLRRVRAEPTPAQAEGGTEPPPAPSEPAATSTA